MGNVTRPRRSRAVILLAAALALTTAPTTLAQQTFQFFLSAADATGARVRNLKIDEIAVSESGRPGRILKLDPITWPVRVTVMVDNGLGTGTLLVQYRNGLKGFFEALPVGVEASLLTLAPQPRWIVRPTNDRLQLLRGIDRISPDPGSARFVDALIEVADRIEKENKDQINYYPVIVIMSTTGPEGSQPRDRDLEKMVRQMERYAARVHVVMLGIGATSQQSIMGARQVQIGKLLTDGTGGRYEALAAGSRISTLLPEYGEMVAEAHQFQSQQYLVTAERPTGASGPMGDLSLRLDRPGLTFSATPGGLMP
jgi:hypothetical protein